MSLNFPLLATAPADFAGHLHDAVGKALLPWLPGVEIALEVDEAGTSIEVLAFVAVEAHNHSAARRLDPEAQPGDEVGVGLVPLHDDVAGLLGIGPQAGPRLHEAVLVAIRGAFEAHHVLDPQVRAAWLNLTYAQRHNAQRRPGQLGPRYFEGGEAVPGEAVRVVLQLEGTTVWGVGLVAGGGEGSVDFEWLGFEGGAPETPGVFARGRLAGRALLAADGIWDVVALWPASPAFEGP